MSRRFQVPAPGAGGRFQVPVPANRTSQDLTKPNLAQLLPKRATKRQNFRRLAPLAAKIWSCGWMTPGSGRLGGANLGSEVPVLASVTVRYPTRRPLLEVPGSGSASQGKVPGSGSALGDRPLRYSMTVTGSARFQVPVPRDPRNPGDARMDKLRGCGSS